MRLAMLALLVLGSTACSTKKSMVDLDGVLTVFIQTLDAIDVAVGPSDAIPELTPMTSEESQPQLEGMLLEAFAASLNENSHITHYDTWLGTSLQPDGALKGFDDPNKNGTQDAGEADVFKVEVDLEGSRVIATDLKNTEYRRDSGIRRAGLGLGTGLLLGRMLGNQSAMGLSSSRFSGMTMSNRGYHASTGARRVSSGSARSVGGSRSPSLGK